jgi:diacylglycerol O-acyltransferase
VVEIVPYVPIATTLRFGVAVLSYCDRVVLGVTGDRDSTPDIDVLVRGIEDGLSELVAAAGGAAAARPAAAVPAGG